MRKSHDIWHPMTYGNSNVNRNWMVTPLWYRRVHQNWIEALSATNSLPEASCKPFSVKCQNTMFNSFDPIHLLCTYPPTVRYEKSSRLFLFNMEMPQHYCSQTWHDPIHRWFPPASSIEFEDFLQQSPQSNCLPKFIPIPPEFPHIPIDSLQHPHKNPNKMPIEPQQNPYGIPAKSRENPCKTPAASQ